MKTCAFYTLGCKVNQYETQSIRENFVKAGYREVDFNESCDVYVINTCTVTEKTDKESRHLIRKTHKQNPSARIVVTGCYTELNSQDIAAIPGVSFIIKNADKGKITAIIGCGEYASVEISDFKDRSRAFLKIQDGCNNFCSYCKVPLVRGRSVSRSKHSIIAEAKRLISRGFKEIVLTGICLGSWGEELRSRENLSNLLNEMSCIDGNFRIRLSSIEPKYVGDSLLDVMKSSAKICKHLHVPLQSGDDKILKMMNRPYTFAEYVKIIDNARRIMPEVSITTDILLGFPVESERAFRNTCELISVTKPSRVHIFPYSKRNGTKAASMEGKVPKEVVAKRIKITNALASKVSYEYRKKFLGLITEVLVEEERGKTTCLLKGYDDKYISVILENSASKNAGKYVSNIVKVRIQKVDFDLTYGIIIG